MYTLYTYIKFAKCILCEPKIVEKRDKCVYTIDMLNFNAKFHYMNFSKK